MSGRVLVLKIEQAQVGGALSAMRASGASLDLAQGDFALIEARESAWAAAFTDLCCGILAPQAGRVRFLGHDWATLPPDKATALRGRIGLLLERGAWLDMLDVAGNILLPHLHHTRLDEAALRQQAATLAVTFGLPGLPTAKPRDLTPTDLIRAACVRAFLGRPALLILERPLQGHPELLSPLLGALMTARNRGAGVIWLTGSDLVWRDRSLPATQRLQLGEGGLKPVQRMVPTAW
jgi:phospholipid/cholesterol/gamma-HCH transport system ATP-binding protein